MNRKKTINYILITVFFCLIFPSIIFGQPKSHDFYGTARIDGRDVIADSDVIIAYDPHGVEIGSNYTYLDGNYAIHADGDDLSTTGIDEGAEMGDLITFKINGRTASITSGSNVWSAFESTCNIEVYLSTDPIADPGGSYSDDEGSSIQFNGSNSQNAVSYSWNFGDGGSGTGAAPSHTYADEGNYTVTLTVTNGLSETHDSTTTANISNVAPTADAGGNKSGNEGYSFSFNGTATDPGSADNLTYSWDFGDGGTGSGQNVSHAFQDNDVYTVELTVNDGDGGEDTDQLSVTTSNVAPTVDINGPYYGIVNQEVQFDKTTGSDPGSGDELTYTWDFDNDGQYDDDTGSAASWTFSFAGVYPIGVKLEDDDGDSDTDQTDVTITQAVEITIASNPSGRQVKVGGQTHTTPQKFHWVPGSQHSIDASSPQYNSSMRYVFTSWSHGQSSFHSYTTPSSNTEITANFKKQYKLVVTSPHGNPWGESYYDIGQTASFGVTSPDQESTDIRHVFQSWGGTGSGSYSGANSSHSVTMNNNSITEKASWQTQYLVQTTGNPPEGGTLVLTPPFTDGWYEANTQMRISATINPSFEWGGWSGDLNGQENPKNFMLDGPKQITANFSKETLITIETDPPGLDYEVDDQSYASIQTFNWPAGSQHTLTALSPQEAASPGVQYVYDAWSDGGQQTHTYDVPAIDQTVTVSYVSQYYVDIVSDYGTPSGEGWYNPEDLVNISIDTVSTVSSTHRYIFTRWLGKGSGSYSGQNPSPSIIITEPLTQEAVWEEQYKVTIQIEPAGSGTVYPFPGNSGWAKADTTVELSGVGNIQMGYGFSLWTGDLSGSDNPGTLNVNGAKNITAHFVEGKVIINTDPSGLKVFIDQVVYVAPVVFDWVGSETHELDTYFEQGDLENTKYFYNSWSDGQPQKHDIVTSGSEQTFTASFRAAYKVTVNSDYGIPYGESWYEEGSVATIGVDSLIPESASFRRRFYRWVGSGVGGVTSTNRKLSFPVLGIANEQAEWISQFTINVVTDPLNAPGDAISANPPGPWYDQNTTVELSVFIEDTNYSFVGWQGLGPGLNTNWVVNHTVQGPTTITAVFDTDNEPPQISGLQDLDLAEDGVWKTTVTDLMTYVSDPDDPIDSLSLSIIGGDKFNAQINSTTGLVKVSPIPNWNGESNIFVQVQDPFGATDSDTLLIKVHSMPDSPGEFTLISPPDTTMSVWDTSLLFKWHSSKNVDQGDQISYSFISSPQPDLSGNAIGIITQDTSSMLLPRNLSNLYWGVLAKDTQGNQTWCKDDFHHIRFMVGVDDPVQALPGEFSLSQNYPNPFNPETIIPFQTPQQTDVHVLIYDIRGRLVQEMIMDALETGYHEIIWNGRNHSGNQVSSGVYLIVMRAQDFVARQKTVLIR